MTYKALAESLRSVADQAEIFFRKSRGVSGFKVESAIHPEIGCPTLHAQTRDHHLLCVEVSESPYPATLDRFVLDCVRLGLPVKLFIAVPKPTDPRPSGYDKELSRARDCGVGVVEIEGETIKVVQEPVPLSLSGLRQVDRKDFPQKYREMLAQAESTFRQGNPAKGCSEIYDEIESLSRRIAEKTLVKGMWISAPGPGFNFKKDAWANVVRTMIKRLDYAKANQISESLLARILGLTSHRNDTNHKPANKKHLMRRDRELRTRFENAVDLLAELVNASRSLRV